MFHQQDYDLSRQKYAEYNARFDGLYVPIQGEKPGFARRLLTTLLSRRRERAPKVMASTSAAPRHAVAK